MHDKFYQICKKDVKNLFVLKNGEGCNSSLKDLETVDIPLLSIYTLVLYFELKLPP